MSVAIPITVNIAAAAYPASIPIMKGISLTIFLPYTEQIVTTKRVISPHKRHTSGFAAELPSASSTFPFVISLTAFAARDKPIIETVGPITTAGISLFIQPTPTNLTAIAIITYTRPAKAAPSINPT